MSVAETISPPSPERLRNPVDYSGLYGRLVLSDQKSLNPSKTCEKEDLKIASFEARNYSPFENASRSDRSKFWQEKSPQADFENQYDEWSNNLVGSFNGESGKKIKEDLSPLLELSGVAKSDEGTFTNADAKKLYDRYFSPSLNDSGVKVFVKDVIASYSPSGRIDGNKIQNDILKIQWLANIFGEDAKDMVTHLIAAEIELQESPKAFVENLSKTTHDPATNKDIMRINNLDDEEKRILEFITQNQSVPRQTSPPIHEEQPNDEEESEEEKELPIMAHEEAIKNLIKNNDLVIIIGGTGSGKTTQIPQFIRKIMEKGEKLIVTEPRQINTEDLATRVAEESGLKLGEEIGFKHGDKESDPSDKRDTTFNTEGTLLNRLIHDPTLNGINYVMIDEVHVRSTDTEELLAFLKIAQKLRKERGMPPLKIIAASATVKREQLETYLGTKAYDVPGSMYDVEPHFETKELTREQKVKRAAEIVKELNGKRGTGLIAVATIRDMEEYAKAVQKENPDAIIIKLHSGSSDEEKAESKLKAPKGKRRIIIATDFIQTGITVPDLKYVINTGEVNQSTIDRQSGLEFPDVIEQTKAEIDQWKGRAGRKQKGDIYHLYTEQSLIDREDYPKPEIQRSDLTKLVLHLKRRKITDPSSIEFLSQLDKPRIDFAEETLRKLDAVNPDGRLNDIGKRMLELPTDFHLARMIVAAEQSGKGIKDICTIAAMIDSRGLIKRGEDAKIARFKHPESDFLTYLNIWNEFEANGQTEEWAEANGLNHSVLQKAIITKDKLLRNARSRNGQPATDEDLQKSIYEGYKDRLMKFDPAQNSYTSERHNVTFKLFIDRNSSLAGKKPQYIIAGGNSKILRNKDGRLMNLTTIQEVKPEWL